jgi:hypothetical protein
MNDGQIEGVIPTRPYQHKIMGLGSRYIRPDINDRQLASGFKSIHEVVYLLDIDRFKNVSELQDNMFGIFKIINHILSSQAR